MATSDGGGDDDFYSRLPVFDGFRAITDPARYQPLPDDWLLGLTDVVHSTSAIEAGRYKAVNIAGASVIAAVTNALGSGRSRSYSAATGRAWRFRHGTRPPRAPRSPRRQRGRATSSISRSAQR